VKRRRRRQRASKLVRELGGAKAFVTRVCARNTNLRVVGDWASRDVALALVAGAEASSSAASALESPLEVGATVAGVCVFWDRSRGYGRFRPDGSTAHVFGHSRDLLVGKRVPRGARVRFKLGLRAADSGDDDVLHAASSTSSDRRQDRRRANRRYAAEAIFVEPTTAADVDALATSLCSGAAVAVVDETPPDDDDDDCCPPREEDHHHNMSLDDDEVGAESFFLGSTS